MQSSSEPTTPDPGVAALEVLVGTWSGSGRTESPTIDPIDHVETMTFEHDGGDAMAFRQEIRSAETGALIDAETGFWSVPGPGRGELVIARRSGVVEVLAGFAAPNITSRGTEPGDADRTLIVDVRSTAVHSATHGPGIVSTERTVEVTGDVMRYTLRMSADGQPLQHHRSATLRRHAD
ncbi:MAG: FABP family protein [Actinomycetota bacterium]